MAVTMASGRGTSYWPGERGGGVGSREQQRVGGAPGEILFYKSFCSENKMSGSGPC